MQAEPCSILHNHQPGVEDVAGCVLPLGHDGPHEFVSRQGETYLWETDEPCEDCDCEGDYCTVYWLKAGSIPGVPVAHTDHQLRHHDRTCPACNPDGVPERVKGDGK